MSDIPPARPGRCSAEQKRLRVAELAQAIATGESPGAAARRLCKAWGVSSRRNAARYIAGVFAGWARERKLSRDTSLDVALAVRRRLFRLAVDAGDFSAAARVLDGLDDLLGVGARSGLSVAEIERSLKSPVREILEVLRAELSDQDVLARVIGRIMSVMNATTTTNGTGAPVNRARPFLDD